MLRIKSIADSNASPKFPEGYFCIRARCLKFSFELAVDMKRRIEIQELKTQRQFTLVLVVFHPLANF